MKEEGKFSREQPMEKQYSIKTHPLPEVYEYFCEGGTYGVERAVAVACEGRIRMRQPETRGEGFCDCYGNVVVPCIYDWVRDYCSDISIAGVRGTGRYVDGIYNCSWYGGIDRKGELVIPAVYDWLDDLVEGYTVGERNKKWGMMDKNGVVVAPFIYEDAFRQSDWRGVMYIVDKDGKYGVLGAAGKELVPCSYHNWGDALEKLPEGYLDSAEPEQGERGVFPYEPLRLGPFHFVRAEHEEPYMEPGYYKAVMADRDADVVSPEEYESMRTEYEMRSKECGYKIGLADEAGTIVLPAEYEEVHYAYGKGPKGFTARNGERWYFIELVCGEREDFHENGGHAGEARGGDCAGISISE